MSTSMTEVDLSTDEDEWYHPQFDFADFRRAGTRYVKLLIRARWKEQPGFLTQSELRSWRLENITEDRHDAWQLMEQSALMLETLNREYLPRCGSGGIRPPSQDTPIGRLIAELAFLVHEGVLEADGSVEGGADRNCTLFLAAATLKGGESVPWEEMIDWSKLALIREDLSRLPEPKISSPRNEPHLIEQDANAYVFRRRSDDWVIAFGASGEHPFTNLDGFMYLQHMLLHPHAEHSPMELIELKIARSAPLNRKPREPTIDGSLHDNSRAARPRISDRDALEQYHSRIFSINSELDRANMEGDATRAAILENDKSMILQQVKHYTDHIGRSPNKAARDKVRPAIRNAIERIGKVLPEFASHLHECLNFQTFCYSPRSAESWQF